VEAFVGELSSHEPVLVHQSFMYTPVLLRRHSSRWRAAADVGAAGSGRASAPDASTVQAASTVRVAPDMFLVIRARIRVAPFA
jgi:hypothetical protein